MGCRLLGRRAPRPERRTTARAVPGQQTWQLATGSRIAYVHFATPTARLRGTCDYLPARIAREYHGLLTNSTVVPTSGAGHEAYLERAATYLQLISRFVDEAAPRPLHHRNPKDPV